MKKVRNGSKVKIIDKGSSDNEVGEVGTVNEWIEGDDRNFRVHVPGRDNYVNWHNIDQVEVIKY
jgi:hypothetical protein